jgi:anaerobic ribonucleoside-triphosphate reductase activating protein
MGGEWEHDNLLNLLKIARTRNLKTCLYTGLDDVSDALKSELTWLKTGAWNAELGGLNSTGSNQKFIEVSTNKNLNHLFYSTTP